MSGILNFSFLLPNSIFSIEADRISCGYKNSSCKSFTSFTAAREFCDQYILENHAAEIEQVAACLKQLRCELQDTCERNGLSVSDPGTSSTPSHSAVQPGDADCDPLHKVAGLFTNTINSSGGMFSVRIGQVNILVEPLPLIDPTVGSCRVVAQLVKHRISIVIVSCNSSSLPTANICGM